MFKRLSLCALLCLPAGISHAEGVLKRFYCVVRSVDSASGFTCERYRQPPGSYRIERSAVRVTLLAYQPPAAAHPLAAQAASTLAGMLLLQQVGVEIFAIDRLGRAQARVRLFRADVTAVLLDRGLGRVDREHYGAYYYVPLERAARSARRGIWAAAS